MKYKEFNKFGDTCFRVKNQLSGYMDILSFISNKMFKNFESNIFEFNIKEWNKQFVDWCEEENIYMYKKSNNIERFGFVISFLSKIGILEKKDHKYLVNKMIIDDLLCSKKIRREFFHFFYKNLKSFQEAIDFIYKSNNNINAHFLCIAISLYEKNDNFSEIYQKINNNWNSVLDEITNKSILRCDIENPETFKNTWRKTSSKNLRNCIELLKAIKKQELCKKIIIKNYDNKLIINILKVQEFGYHAIKKRILKNKEEKIEKYLSNIGYKELFKNLEKIRLWDLLENEYADLNIRWFKDFDLVVDGFIDIRKIDFINEEYDILINNIKHYPFEINEVEKYLEKINLMDFSFKNEIEMEDKPNSLIAEYFINIYYAHRMNINIDDFLILCRTCIDNQTLLPFATAPGKGPDMYHIFDNKLRIIETTIHRTRKAVENNEVFNICDHIEIKNIRYLKKEKLENVTNTEVFLISPIKNQEEKNEIITKIERNNKNVIPNKSFIYDFNSFIKSNF